MPESQTVVGYYRVRWLATTCELPNSTGIRSTATAPTETSPSSASIGASITLRVQDRATPGPRSSSSSPSDTITPPSSSKLARFGCSMKELVRLFDLFDSDRIPLVFLDIEP